MPTASQRAAARHIRALRALRWEAWLTFDRRTARICTQVIAVLKGER